MFQDYYKILDVPLDANQDTIKLAFRKEAFKWHPDKNKGIDTTIRMQKINEAYLILQDPEARKRYDIEYKKFKKYELRTEKTNDFGKTEKTMSHEDYQIDDELLAKWMANAKQQAIRLAKESLKDLKGMVKAGAKEAVKEAGKMIIWQIVLTIIVILLLVIYKACEN